MMQKELFDAPMGNMPEERELSDFERHIMNVEALNEPQAIYANLLLVSDFEPEEIEDILEWTPTDEEMREIEDVVSFERSIKSGRKVPAPPMPPMPPQVVFS